jgi:hypothetical protein
MSAVGQQRDPLAPPAGRRRRFHFSDFGSGRTMELWPLERSMDAAAAGEMVFFIPWRVVAEDSGAAH